MIADLLAFLTNLGLGLIKYGAIIGVGIATFAIVVVVAMLMARSKNEADRSYMDKPPALMRSIWPLILLVAWLLVRVVPNPVFLSIDARLKKFGAIFAIKSQEFLAAFVVFPALFLAGVWLVSTTGNEPLNEQIYLLMGLLGLALPEFWLQDLRKKRDREIARSLPVYLEYLSMCVDAGLNFSGALRQAVEKGPVGAMRNEFRIVLRDLRAGFPREKALERMAVRVNLRDLTTFVAAVVQAEKMGASIRDTLRIQAEQRLNERFQKAEKMAMEAPVKLVVPLVLFIFPLTFMMLLFPIAIRFIEEGSLF